MYDTIQVPHNNKEVVSVKEIMFGQDKIEFDDSVFYRGQSLKNKEFLNIKSNKIIKDVQKNYRAIDEYQLVSDAQCIDRGSESVVNADSTITWNDKTIEDCRQTCIDNLKCSAFKFRDRICQQWHGEERLKGD